MAKKKLHLKPKKIIIGPSGKAEEVILPMDAYEELLERVEDAADLAWIESLRVEEKEAIPWEDAIRKLKEDGIL